MSKRKILWKEFMSRSIAHKIDSELFWKVSEVSISYSNKIKASERPEVKTSKDAYAIFMRSWDKDKLELQEQVRAMFLDRKHSCLAVTTVATGGITACVADLKLIFAMALRTRANSLILAHNHPSGNLQPSEGDKSMTRKFKQAGDIMEISLLDHLIVTNENYYSFADDGEISFSKTSDGILFENDNSAKRRHKYSTIERLSLF
jgi:DNA repair protein RadC